MKHPREEAEGVVSLALSLSTTDSSTSGSVVSAGDSSATNLNNNNKRRRRRGPVVATSGEGDFVCKTCGRAFPSFQALGGHRTSHLRGRLDLGVVGAKALKQHKMTHTHQMQADVGDGTAASNEQQKQKHECGVCGMGFEMGQALGGHMRRHREEMAGAGGGAADDWVWHVAQEMMPGHADPPVLLELFA